MLKRPYTETPFAETLYSETLGSRSWEQRERHTPRGKVRVFLWSRTRSIPQGVTLRGTHRNPIGGVARKRRKDKKRTSQMPMRSPDESLLISASSPDVHFCLCFIWNSGIKVPRSGLFYVACPACFPQPRTAVCRV